MRRADAAALACELIASLGSRADYLGDPHTLAHFRSELFEPSFGFVGRREGWQAAGARTAVARAIACRRYLPNRPRRSSMSRWRLNCCALRRAGGRSWHEDAPPVAPSPPFVAQALMPAILRRQLLLPIVAVVALAP
ncbi:MAG TPA: hypothetical protein DEP45_00660, partial [Armatimonadetes bacterium]|nr:hypothetical protein [Armatimonadota bacterium]